jgi:hypothetical protein
MGLCCTRCSASNRKTAYFAPGTRNTRSTNITKDDKSGVAVVAWSDNARSRRAVAYGLRVDELSPGNIKLQQLQSQCNGEEVLVAQEMRGPAARKRTSQMAAGELASYRLGLTERHLLTSLELCEAAVHRSLPCQALALSRDY